MTTATFPAQTKKGLIIQFAIEEADDDQLITHLKNFISKLEKLDIQPIGNGRGEPALSVANVSLTRPPAANPPPTNDNGKSARAYPTAFPAETIVTTIDAGKAYYRIKGGPCRKHGVTVWPEVLEQAGFVLENIPSSEPFPLRGYTAHCILNQNGLPQKVTSLVKQ